MKAPNAPLAAVGALALLTPASTTLACQLPLPSLGSIVREAAQGGCDLPCPPGGSGPHGSLGGSLDGSGRGSPLFEISMVDFAFVPSAPIIKPNTTVRWTNDGLFQHTSTRIPRWDSGFVNPGGFFDHAFTGADAGLAFAYECFLHFGMDGTVNVARFGDANLDGTVNLNDFNILAANFGQTGRTWETGDFNGDGTVNLNDFNLLAANFGQQIQPASARISLDFGTFVPEPSVATLALAALVAAPRARANRRRRRLR